MKAELQKLDGIDSLVDMSCKLEERPLIVPMQEEISKPQQFKLSEADRFIPIRSNEPEEEIGQIYETKMLIETEAPANLFEEGKPDSVAQNNQ